VEINSGVYLIKSLIREGPLFTSGGLGLKNLVLFTSQVIIHKYEIQSVGPALRNVCTSESIYFPLVHSV